MNEVRITLVSRKTILSGTASILAQSGIPISLCYILTTTKRHVESGQPCLRTGCAGQVSFRVRNAEGGYRWHLSRAEPVRASDGTLLYWIGVNLDIEDRKQAELYLAEGQRLAHTGSWAFNAAGFDYWSPELFRIYGLDPSGKAPTIEEYMELVHPDDREFVAETIQKMFAEQSRIRLHETHCATGWRDSSRTLRWQPGDSRWGGPGVYRYGDRRHRARAPDSGTRTPRSLPGRSPKTQSHRQLRVET